MRRSGATAANLAGPFLVRGASRVPLAATALHRATGVPPTVLEQPELTDLLRWARVDPASRGQ